MSPAQVMAAVSGRSLREERFAPAVPSSHPLAPFAAWRITDRATGVVGECGAYKRSRDNRLAALTQIAATLREREAA